METAARSSPDPGPESAFTPVIAERVLQAACVEVGLNASGAQLLRLGENAIYSVGTAPVIVRIARGAHLLPAATKEVAVAAWLAAEGFPAARIALDHAQPIVVQGHPVTFWAFIESAAGDRATYGDLGNLLRRLHSLTPPAELALPVYDVFARTEWRIANIQGIDGVVTEFLRRRCAELRERLSRVEFASSPSALHGDAHVANVMRTSSGEAVMIDFENFALGHPEWDLVVTGDEYESMAWATERQYRDFVSAYGVDITQWAGYEVLRDIQEFKMTTWLMQNVSENSAIADEFDRRLSSIRDGTTRRTWRPF